MSSPINISFPMKKSSNGGFQTNNSTLSAVIDDLRILILTNYGERPIHYDYGANLRSIIFDQGPNLKQRIADSVHAAINKWMPFVAVDSIEVNDASTKTTLSANEVELKINFSVNKIQGVLQQRLRS